MSTIDPPEELLSAYLDGEATPDERALVERRLAESAEWREVLDEVRATRELLLALPVREAPAGFWDSVLQPDIAPPVQLETARRRRGKQVDRLARGRRGGGRDRRGRARARASPGSSPRSPRSSAATPSGRP